MSKTIKKFVSKDKRIKPEAKPAGHYQAGVAKSLTRDKKKGKNAQT